jgi:hypothetical protein
MNERIRELYNTVAGNDKLNFDSYLAEKFAELIIAECCVALHPTLRDMISRTQGVEMIVRHFRNEE